MTAYFDDLARSVSNASTWAAEAHPDDAEERDSYFLARLEMGERRVIRVVNLVTGDREFPDDLRQRIQSIIAMHRITPVESLEPRAKAVEAARVTRTHPLLQELHSAFHDVAQRRIETRFGILSDSPTAILSMRDDWERSR